MANNTKRRDNKGRVLNTGEFQEPSGRYFYTYTAEGVRYRKYSWRLTETDTIPKGKRFCKSLRLLEQEIAKDTYNGIRHTDKTLNEVFDVSINSGYGRASQDTKEDYKYRYDLYIRNHLIGSKPVKNIQPEDIQGFNEDLLDQGVGSSVVDRLNRIISRTMSYAVSRKMRSDNPVTGISVDYSQGKVEALDEQQTVDLLKFVENSSNFSFWYDHIRTLLNTGMRIGEFAGFVWNEYDRSTETIHVQQAVNIHMNPDKTKTVELDSPKSLCGIRDIPANEVVKEILEKRRQEQLADGTYETYTALGTRGFVFLNQAGTFINRDNFRAVMKRIRDAYNEKEQEAAAKEKRPARLMPPIHPHVLRHTFCSRLCEKETNVARIKEIMGHSDIYVTMNIYNQVTLKAKQETMAKVKI